MLRSSLRTFSAAARPVRTALVTGSTSGIGQGIAEVFAANGFNVVLNGFGEAAHVKALQGRLSEHGVKVTHIDADLRTPDGATKLVKDAEAAMGSVDVLVNNAGIQFVSPIETFPQDAWDSIIAVNLTAVMATTKAALPGMRSRKWGRIINVSSVHGLVASGNKSAYVASKHGVIGLTRVTAIEAANTGVTCNAICPGWVMTPLVQKQIEARAKEAGISVELARDRMLAEKQPQLDFATPTQLGQLALFLSSDHAKQITGASIPMDGGWTIQ